MITNNLSTLDIHQLSEQQFQRIVENGEYDENALYLTPDKVVLIITIDEVNAVASHTATEIYSHVQGGGFAVLDLGLECGVPLLLSETQVATFGHFSAEENRLVEWVINDQGNVEFYERWLAEASRVKTFGYWMNMITGNANLFEIDMTWREYCDSFYNYEGIRCDDDNAVHFSNGDRMMSNRTGELVLPSDIIRPLDEYDAE